MCSMSPRPPVTRLAGVASARAMVAANEGDARPRAAAPRKLLRDLFCSIVRLENENFILESLRCRHMPVGVLRSEYPYAY